MRGKQQRIRDGAARKAGSPPGQGGVLGAKRREGLELETVIKCVQS